MERPSLLLSTPHCTDPSDSGNFTVPENQGLNLRGPALLLGVEVSAWG